jgi:hypothetical protein
VKYPNEDSNENLALGKFKTMKRQHLAVDNLTQENVITILSDYHS